MPCCYPPRGNAQLTRFFEKKVFAEDKLLLTETFQQHLASLEAKGKYWQKINLLKKMIYWYAFESESNAETKEINALFRIFCEQIDPTDRETYVWLWQCYFKKPEKPESWFNLNTPTASIMEAAFANWVAQQRYNPETSAIILAGIERLQPNQTDWELTDFRAIYELWLKNPTMIPWQSSFAKVTLKKLQWSRPKNNQERDAFLAALDKGIAWYREPQRAIQNLFNKIQKP